MTARLRAPSASVPDQGEADLLSASPRHRLLTARFTPDQAEAMMSRLRDGATYGQVAAEFQIGLTSLKRLARARRQKPCT